MKVFIQWIMILPCILSSSISFAQDYEEVKAFAMKYANRYCSNAAEILEAEEARSIAFYMDFETEQLNVSKFGTAVHEGLHNYDWELADEAEDATPEWSDRWKAYFVNTGIVLATEEKSVFKTSTLHDRYFPQGVKEMSRYETYIQEWGDNVSDENSKLSQSEINAYGVSELRPGEARTTSNVKGIYGLMEEFNAYHHGVKAEYELITGWDEADVAGSTNSVAAYYEFNVFMAYYLKYAREKEREVYNMMMNDQNLRIAYTLIELSWRELITKIYANEKTTNYFMYWRGEPELYTDELRNIMAGFMIPNNQLGKYASYANSKRYNEDVKALTLQKISEDRPGSSTSISDMDWGGFENWDDGDGNSSTSSDEVSFNIEPMMPGNYYVIVSKEDDLFNLVDKINQYKDREEVKVGMNMDDQNTYYFVIAKFGTSREAEEHARKNRAKYPNVEVVSF